MTSANLEPARVGLPGQVRGCLFDLDGVLTPTARVHAAAWKQMFDEYLRARSARSGGPFVPFTQADYEAYVDGKRREDGVRSFLESRGIALSEGEPDDPPEAETVRGLGNRKNALVVTLLRRDGVDPYPDADRYVRAAREAGLACAVVSSSANTREVLAAARLDGQFEVVVDGIVAAAERLPGKPDPATFLAAAERLGLAPAQAAVFEDAVAGAEAGRAGAFGCVVGVDRVGHADALREAGADVVVAELTELLEPRP